jgi:ribonuclease BN (tRNA processing enzyme)
MILTVVGCSGSVAGPDSAASCYLLEAHDGARPWRIVFDLGSGAVGPLQRYVELHAIDAVLLSHSHPDHAADAQALSVALRYGYPDPLRDALPMYGPAGIGEVVSEPEAADPFAITELCPAPGGTVSLVIGPFTITVAPAWHPVQALAFRVDGPGEDGGRVTLTYTGDTDRCEAIDALADGVDLLLAEAGWAQGDTPDGRDGVHMTGRQAGELARDARPGRLVLTHIPPWADREATAIKARAIFDGSVALASAGECLSL